MECSTWNRAVGDVWPAVSRLNSFGPPFSAAGRVSLVQNMRMYPFERARFALVLEHAQRFFEQRRRVGMDEVMALEFFVIFPRAASVYFSPR